MIENYTPAEYRVETTYELTFDDGCGNGYVFPCDKDGNLLEGEKQNPAAYKNYSFRIVLVCSASVILTSQAI